MVFPIVILVLAFALIAWIGYMATPPRPRLRVGESARDHGAEAWIEDHDIDEMIEARNERRRRLGRPEIGDELARELESELRRSS